MKLSINSAALFFTSMALVSSENCIAHSTETQQRSDSYSVPPLVNTVGTPWVEDPKTGRLYDDDRVRELVNSEPPMRATNCLVDFTDQQALAFTEPSLWFDRIHVPWFQACETLKFVDIRPTYYGHLHLGFSDEHVLPCTSNDMAYPSLIDNGECDFVDVPTEPRTHITTHNSGEHVLVRLDDSNKYITFNFHQLKVMGENPIQLCFKKPFSNDEPWIAQSPSSGSTSGPWLCWPELGAGNWNIEYWAQDVSAVRISPTGGFGSISFDNIEISF